VRCTVCATEEAETGGLCHSCGAEFSAAQAARQLEGERRLVTILFADITGFTRMAEQLDPEPLRDLINSCFDRLVPCVEGYGGTVHSFLGDEIMAIFGAPVANENDPERALAATLEMRAALEEFSRERSDGLQAHFGVNTGRVVAGQLGSQGRSHFSVVGDAVNVAARLVQAAEPSQILVGRETWRRTQSSFRFRPAGSLQVKGRSGPVEAYELTGMAAGPLLRSPVIPGRLESSLVGREMEMAALQDALAELDQGSGGLITLLGGAGLGKSRLLGELRRRAGVHTTWLQGDALSFGRSISYWPFLEILQQTAGIEPDHSEQERYLRLDRRASELFGQDTAEFAPYLATMLGLEVPGELRERVRHLDGEAMGRQLFRAMRRFVEALTAEGPLVLVFEDVHWMDASSVALVEHLMPLVVDTPLLLVMAGRAEQEEATARLRASAGAFGPRHTEIQAHPLSANESARLAANLVSVESLPLRLTETIHRKAEGNPFFVEEVVRSLIELGGLVQQVETREWQVTDAAQAIRIPDTLEAVILARIDRLDGELRQVLRLASVIGRSFLYRVLDAIAEADLRLEEDLTSLEALELLREKARLPELEYVFRHPLVHEATYESMLVQRRREVHRSVAAVVEGLFSDRRDEFSALLAYHYSRAEDWSKAQEYLLKAGDWASSLAGNAEAVNHYEQAIGSYSRAFGEEWDSLQHAVLERKLGEALVRLGEHERGREHLYKALSLMGAPFPLARGKVRLAIAREVLRQAAYRLLRRSRAAPGEEAESATAQERWHIYYSLVWVDFFAHPERTLLDVLLSLNISESVSSPLPQTISRAGVAELLCMVPMSRTAGWYERTALRAAEQSDDPRARAYAYIGLAARAFWLTGEWGSSIIHFQEANTIFRSVADTHEWAGFTAGLAHLLADCGELDEGLALVREVAQVGLETGDRAAEAWGLTLMGEVLDYMGRVDEAVEVLGPLPGLLLELRDVQNAAKAAGRLAHCYLAQGRLSDAQGLLAEHEGHLAAHGLRGQPIRNVRTARAELTLLVAEFAEGDARGPALKEARRACRSVLKHGRLDTGARIIGYRSMGTLSWLTGRPGRARRWWERSLRHAEKLGARYQAALTLLELGQRTQDSALISRARQELVPMGASARIEADGPSLPGARRT
jgi:class 3 adenylate cyclase/tetratricopeptide (TPR) repeat protein